MIAGLAASTKCGRLGILVTSRSLPTTTSTVVPPGWVRWAYRTVARKLPRPLRFITYLRSIRPQSWKDTSELYVTLAPMTVHLAQPALVQYRRALTTQNSVLDPP